ncbi:MAG: calcium/proton exchanger [Anaerolineales bacterium]|nr:calcium/proton exchanger [Anaerolineales bacterium]
MTALSLRSIKPLHYLLLALPVAILGSLLHWNPLFNFVVACAGLIPLAELIGEATEQLAVFTGPKIGGLLNATLGNAAELIITLVAIRAGLLDLVKASITGSIIGNLLLVMGASLLFGGLRHGTQTFHRGHAATNSTLLVLAVLALCVPSIFNHTSTGLALPTRTVESISLGVAGVMIVLYALGLIYSLRSAGTALAPAGAEAAAPHWSRRTALIVLALATLAVVWLSEILVESVEPVTAALGLSEFFLGIILIPIIGNVAEHLVAVEVSLKNKMDLSLEIALGSSLQIALFVAPVLVFASLLFGHELNLVFNQFELLALIGAVAISALVASDGETNWLEGAQLLGVYIILGVAFFFIPG